MTRLLGIDVGTSGCKAIVLSESGSGSWRVVTQASESYPVSMPHPTWSEQDPENWWVAAKRCMSAVGCDLWAEGSGQSTANSGQLTAIGLTGQMHGAVFLDENGDVIRPAILWNDQRTTEECEDINRIVGSERVREITCNPPLTGFQLPKILWLRKREPENFARVRKVLLPKDYIRYRLTSEFFTEVSDASGTGIFDVRKREWSCEMMDALDLDPSMFPSVVESTEQTGFIETPTKEAEGVQSSSDSNTPSQFATLTDLPRKVVAGEDSHHKSRISHPASAIPIFGGAGDQASGAVGVGAVREGVINISLGTSGVVFSSIRDPGFEVRDSLHTFCHANGAWHVMGVMLACGGALSWYAQNVRHASFDDVMAEAAEAEPGCGGLTFLPYLSGERSPHNDPNARAAFAGLNISHCSKEMSRAVIEGITFGLRDCIEALREIRDAGFEMRDGSTEQGSNTATPEHRNTGKPNALMPQRLSADPSPRLRVTGGGAKSRFWVQMIADVFGCPVETLEADEGPAFGAALIAGVGAGVWPDLQAACDATIRIRERLEPSGVEYEEPYQQYRTLYPHLKEWFRT